MDEQDSLQHLCERLPEFTAQVDEHLACHDELLFHLVMGDLARFYWDTVRHDAEMARRFWMSVDWMAIKGDQYVENAVGVSLIEWFAWGSKEEQQVLLDAAPLQGSHTRAIVEELMAVSYARPDAKPKGRTSGRKRPPKPRRSTRRAR